MSARDDVLERVRGNLPKGVHDLPVVPLFHDDEVSGGRIERFKHWLELMGGKFADVGPTDDPLKPIRDLCWQAKVVCSMVPEFQGNREITASTDPHTLRDVDVAIVRAAFGVAETGSVLLVDTDLGVNALVYLAQHLIVLLDPTDIRAEHARCLSSAGVPFRPLRVVPHGAFGHRRHRGRADPRRAGCAIPDRYSASQGRGMTPSCRSSRSRSASGCRPPDDHASACAPQWHTVPNGADAKTLIAASVPRTRTPPSDLKTRRS